MTSRAFLLVSLLIARVAVSQINTGRISGSVTDPAGAGIPAVQMRVTNEETGVMTRGQSFDSGDYLINFLVPGKYKIEAEKEGFQRVVESGVVVNAGGITRLDFSLRIGEVRQAVEVGGNVIEVATETAELSQTFSMKDLDRLPNIDRNPLYQMNLMPGANNDRGSGNYGLNGGENGSAVGQTRNQLASLGGVDANANSVLIEGTFNREPQNAYVGSPCRSKSGLIFSVNSPS